MYPSIYRITRLTHSMTFANGVRSDFIMLSDGTGLVKYVIKMRRCRAVCSVWRASSRINGRRS